MSGSTYSGPPQGEVDLDGLTRRRQRLVATYLQDPLPPSRGRGNHHTAQISSDVERTVEFWQGLLEMPLTEMFENRDLPGSTHFFFDIGAGNLIGYFDLPGVAVEEYREVLGGHHHIAISVTKENWDYLRAKLDEAGVEYHVASKSSIYFLGPDGERLELLADPLGEMYGTKVL
jgi:catechol 2,3-dioxygenase-like lactoylglutathione lyase family enzyme